MHVAVTEMLELQLPPGAERIRLSPGEAFDLAAQLVRRGIRRAMQEEADELDADHEEAQS